MTVAGSLLSFMRNLKGLKGEKIEDCTGKAASFLCLVHFIFCTHFTFTQISL